MSTRRSRSKRVGKPSAAGSLPIQLWGFGRGHRPRFRYSAPGAPWDVVVEMAILERDLVIRELTITPRNRPPVDLKGLDDLAKYPPATWKRSTPRSGITHATLRSIPIQQIITEAKRLILRADELDKYAEDLGFRLAPDW